MILWYGKIFRREKSGSVCELAFEFVMVRIAFFCIITSLLMQDFGAQLTMRGQYDRWEWIKEKYSVLSVF